MLALVLVMLVQTRVYIKNRWHNSEHIHEDVAQWALDHGYRTGFSTFSHASVITELTDGKVDMYHYAFWTDGDMHRWLQKTEHFEQVPEGPVFVYVDHREWLEEPVPCAREDHLAYVTEGGGARIYVYDSAEEIFDLQREYRRNYEAQFAVQ